MKPHEQPAPAKKSATLWIVLAVVLAVVAIGILWWWKNANQPVFSGACQTKDMSLEVGDSQTADGIEFIHAVLTNKGKTTCTLTGYPVVSLLDKNGENFSYGDAQHNDFYATETVTLTPRAQAHTVVSLPKAENFDEGACSGTLATLRLFLPAPEVTADMNPLSTPLERRTCPGFSVTAIRPGA